jgi:hypothetical protein
MVNPTKLKSMRRLPTQPDAVFAGVDRTSPQHEVPRRAVELSPIFLRA